MHCQTDDIDDSPISVPDIMADIKKKAMELESELSTDESKHEDRLSKRIPSLAVECDPRIGIEPVSYRNNIIGRLIVIVKKILLSIFKLYGNALLHRQAEINYEIVKTLQMMNVTYLKRISDLQKENSILKERIEKISTKGEKEQR